MSRRVLIVSPHFPPTNAPDHQRARQALPHLAEFGWAAEVLAVDPAGVEAPVDPLLAEALPPGLPVHRVRALPPRLGRLLGFGSLGLRAHRALGAAGARLLRARRFDLVLFTTTQFIVLTLGPRWRRLTGTPYVLDWQDPWLTDYYDRPGAPPPPGGWKYRLARWQARRFEGECVRGAAGMVATSPTYLATLAARYPDCAGRPSAVIPFGASADDFRIAARADVSPAFVRRPGVRHLAFVGAAGPVMADALHFLFEGLAAWCAADPARRERLRLHFIGTSYAPGDRAVPSVLPLAAAAGVADLVEEQPRRVGHFAALRTLRDADALLLLGSGDAGYSPSKIATLALAARPVLAVIPGGGQLEASLRGLAAFHLARFSPQREPVRIGEFLDRDFTAPLPVDPDPEYGARHRTRQLSALLEQALATPT